MKDLKFPVYHFFIISILLIQGYSTETDLVTNGDFSDVDCNSITATYADCQGEGVLSNWKAKFISNNTVAPISVQTKSKFKWFPYTTNVVPLDVYSQGIPRPYTRTCIEQQLSSDLATGIYTLEWQAATRSNQTDLKLSHFNYKVGITNNDGSPGALSYISTSFLVYGYESNTYTFDVQSAKTDQVVSICSRAFKQGSSYYNDDTETHAAGIGRVKLIKYEFDPEAEKPLNENLIRNRNFKVNNCLDQLEVAYQCQGTGLMVPFWSAHYINGQATAPMSPQTVLAFYSFTSLGLSTRVIPLDVYDSSYPLFKRFRRTCIKQELGKLIPGRYKLEFDSSPKIGLVGSSIGQYSFKVYVSNDDKSVKSLPSGTFSFGSAAPAHRTTYFTLKTRKSNQNIYVCSELAGGASQTTISRAAGVTNFDLRNLGCPSDSHKEIPLDDGYLGCITNNEFCQCDIYKYTQASNTTTCTASCIHNTKMQITQPYTGYRCPTAPDLPFYDTHCLTYDDKGAYQYRCNACNDPYRLKNVLIGQNIYKRCLQNQIPGCVLYNLDGTCVKLSANCYHALIIDETMFCVACNVNFILDKKHGCQAHVEHCAEYPTSGVCSRCVSGYFLYDNVCYKVKGNCDMYDEKTKVCSKCASEYQLRNNECFISQPCSQGEYRNNAGFCTPAKDKNCRQYQPLTGDCVECKNNYKFNDNLLCIADPKVECPPDNEEYVYLVVRGKCVQIQSACTYVVGDQCGACVEGFYLERGVCKRVQEGEEGYRGLVVEGDTGN